MFHLLIFSYSSWANWVFWDSMILWNSWSIERAPEVQGPLRNNLPLRSSQDLKEGLPARFTAHTTIEGCDLVAHIRSMMQSVQVHPTTGLTWLLHQNLSIHVSSPLMFQFPLFLPHLSQSALRSQWQLKAGDFYNIKLPSTLHVYRDHSNNHAEHLLTYQEFTLIKVMGPQLLEALNFTAT